jgi:hypothetical protein
MPTPPPSPPPGSPKGTVDDKVGAEGGKVVKLGRTAPARKSSAPKVVPTPTTPTPAKPTPSRQELIEMVGKIQTDAQELVPKLTAQLAVKDQKWDEAQRKSVNDAYEELEKFRRKMKGGKMELLGSITPFPGQDLNEQEMQRFQLLQKNISEWTKQANAWVSNSNAAPLPVYGALAIVPLVASPSGPAPMKPAASRPTGAVVTSTGDDAKAIADKQAAFLQGIIEHQAKMAGMMSSDEVGLMKGELEKYTGYLQRGKSTKDSTGAIITTAPLDDNEQKEFKAIEARLVQFQDKTDKWLKDTSPTKGPLPKYPAVGLNLQDAFSRVHANSTAGMATGGAVTTAADDEPLMGVLARPQPLIHQARLHAAQAKGTPLADAGNDLNGKPVSVEALIRDNLKQEREINSKYGSLGVKAKADKEDLRITIPAPGQKKEEEVRRFLQDNTSRISMSNPPSDLAIRLTLNHLSSSIAPLSMQQSCKNGQTLIRLYEASIASNNGIKFTESDEALLKTQEPLYSQLTAIKEKNDPTLREALNDPGRQLGAPLSPEILNKAGLNDTIELEGPKKARPT